MDLKEVQDKLLLQLEDAAQSFYGKDRSYTSSIGYLQGVGDCCALAGISNSEIQDAKWRGHRKAGVD
jgi:hypothetical protein